MSHPQSFPSPSPSPSQTNPSLPARIDPSLRLRRAIHASDTLLCARILKSHPPLLHNPDFSPTGLSNTSLHLACQLGHLAIVHLLLSLGHESAGISLNEDHQTPLMLASREGHTDIVNHLCTHPTSPEPGIERQDIRGRDAVNAFVTSPLLLPQILTGVALLQFFTLVHLHQSYWALLIGHVVVTTPYVVRTVTATLTHFDLALEEAAQSLGAHPVRAFLEITLGVIKPGVVAGAIFAFAISFDNFTLSLFLTSSRLTPLPIELFAYLKYSFDPTAAAVSAVAIGVALVVVLGIARVVGLEEFTGF